MLSCGAGAPLRCTPADYVGPDRPIGAKSTHVTPPLMQLLSTTRFFADLIYLLADRADGGAPKAVAATTLMDVLVDSVGRQVIEPATPEATEAARLDRPPVRLAL